jgi:hypothetical protein
MSSLGKFLKLQSHKNNHNQMMPYFFFSIFGIFSHCVADAATWS